MSTFKDELLKSVAPQVDITQSVHSKIDSCISELVTERIEDTYKYMSDKILGKAKSSEYEKFGSTRTISGYVNILNGDTRYTAEGFWPIQSTYPDHPYTIASNYLRNFPDVSMSSESSDLYWDKSRWFVFSCELINRVKHSPAFFGKDYYTYHCSDITKKIIAGIQKKAAIDNIQVDFSHIELSVTFYEKTNIPDGGSDKGCRNTCLSGSVVLKYSISF